MNNLTVAGQIGRDAELRYLPNGDAVVNFSIADQQGKNKDPIWWRASIFGKRAESLAPYLIKGASITVTGNLTERTYEKDGKEQKAMELRVNDLALQGGRKQEEAPRQAPKAAPHGGKGTFDDMDEMIPF